MNKKIFFAFCLLILASLACHLPFMHADDADGIEKRLPDLNADTFDATVKDLNLLAAVPLSAAQRQILLVRGQPNRFLMMFLDGLREETWYYDQFGYEVTFRNGDIFTEVEGNSTAGWEDIVTIYSPWQFNKAMGLNELLSVSKAETFTIESLAESFEEEITLLYMKGLVAGLRGEDLLFVRTIPIGEGAKILDIPVNQPPAENQFDADSNLTAAELAHVGTHTYRTYCTYSDGKLEDYTEPVTWAFKEDGVYWAGDGPFPWIKENLYGISDSEGKFFIYFQENVITITGEFIRSGAEDEQMLITFACAATQE
jgi:hypothetical protein